MDVLVAKIMIMIGLLFCTLVAALMPYICIKGMPRKRRRRHAEENYKACIFKGCLCWNRDIPQEVSEDPETKESLEHGNNRANAVHRRKAKSRTKMITSGLNCFAGGIFLGTSFIGMLPEIRESFEKFNITWPVLTNKASMCQANATDCAMHKPDPMPIAEIIVVCGLFFILSVEQAAHSLNHWRLKRKGNGHGQKHSNSNHSHTPVMNIQMKEVDGVMIERVTTPNHDISGSPSVSIDSSEKPPHDHSGIRSLMLVAILSIHSLLEGIALGLQDSVGSLVAIFIAVLFHKSLIAFSMGTNLAKTNKTFKKVLYAGLIFSLASPIGMGIGIAVKTAGGENGVTDLVTAILQAVATGTFLYVTFFEVLVPEFEAHGHRLLKVLSLFIGYAAVLGSFFPQHD